MPRASFGRYFADMGSALDQEVENGQIRPKKGKVILYLFKPVSRYFSSFTEFVAIQEASENCCGMTSPLRTSFKFITKLER